MWRTSRRAPPCAADRSSGEGAMGRFELLSAAQLAQSASLVDGVPRATLEGNRLFLCDLINHAGQLLLVYARSLALQARQSRSLPHSASPCAPRPQPAAHNCHGPDPAPPPALPRVDPERATAGRCGAARRLCRALTSAPRAAPRHDVHVRGVQAGGHAAQLPRRLQLLRQGAQPRAARGARRRRVSRSERLAGPQAARRTAAHRARRELEPLQRVARRHSRPRVARAQGAGICRIRGPPLPLRCLVRRRVAARRPGGAARVELHQRLVSTPTLLASRTPRGRRRRHPAGNATQRRASAGRLARRT
jgi:hypothetical protein